jgi:hypothetical protein
MGPELARFIWLDSPPVALWDENFSLKVETALGRPQMENFERSAIKRKVRATFWRSPTRFSLSN